MVKFYHGIPEERVFVHPSSANFSVGQYSCPWMVYYQLVRTSKPFMRDVTECSKYDLLLFGGSIEVLAADGLIVVDNYVRMSANARIGELFIQYFIMTSLMSKCLTRVVTHILRCLNCRYEAKG